MAKKVTNDDDQFLFDEHPDNDFLDKKELSSDKNRLDINSLQPKMLPPMFKERTKFTQRLFLLLIVFFASVAVGTVAFVILNDIAEKWGVTTNGIPTGESITYLIINIVLLLFTLAGSITFVYWSRSRAYSITWVEFIAYILPSILMTGGLLYLNLFPPEMQSASGAENAMMLFRNIGFLSIAMALIPAIMVLITNLLKNKTYREAKFRTFWTLPGLMIMAIGSLLLWVLAKGELSSKLSLMGVLAAVGSLVVGGMVFALGMMFSTKYKVSGIKHLWSSVRFTGSLSTVIVFTVLLVISAMFFTDMQMSLPLIIVLGFDFVMAIGFGVFAIFKGRIKNISKTNPIFNEFMLKSFIISLSIVALIVVAILPKIYPDTPSYSESSYGILLSTSFFTMVIVVTAHFANLITFSKFFKSILGGMILTTILALVVLFTIATIKYSHILMQILARPLVMFFLVVALIVEVILFMSNITFIYRDVLSASSKQKKKTKKEKAAEVEKNKEALRA